MTDVALDAPLFRKMFREFADEDTTPDDVLAIRWTEATGYVSPTVMGDLTDAQRQYAVHCMTAHLCRLAAVVASAAQGMALAGVVIGAQIDKVQVQLQPPPSRGEWGHWLAQTPYGAQLSAFLAARSVGGSYVGGLPERQGFRKVGGVF